jgi:hypothetical protein
MNIIFEIDDVLPQNIYFLEQKRNIIMDGYFTKLIYSNEHFTMNGIYLHFSMKDLKLDNIMNKQCVHFHTYHPKNLEFIQTLSMIELHILELYKKTHKCNKRISNNLAKQLYSGIVKITKDYYSDEGTSNSSVASSVASNVASSKSGPYVIKISGVWENSEDIGITFKLRGTVGSP